MASVFTYDPDPPRVSSPWSTTSGSSTPQMSSTSNRVVPRTRSSTTLNRADPDLLSDYGIAKLEPEPQEGPTEYKLHLLLRPRRPFVAMSTGHLVGGSYHFRASLSTASPTPSSYESAARPPQARSAESRQQRLQHLTTQLLWRLQQSSPFHSSTAANLVLPVLPDASPSLGAPQKPARLLPGLEESQGALYEIGVADDGTFVGLTADELEESLSTLQVMAASLGCKVDILRRVIVGKCEWIEDSCDAHADTGKVHTESLWVAEALVSPDWEFYRVESPKAGSVEGEASASTPERRPALGDSSTTEQIRISISGPSAAGKSSLLGTLTSSVLDNGRGTSRLGLLKHRHEISSGITSSVAHELIGYASNESTADTVDVINYASGNIAAWDDIHASSEGGRLAFVSDLPGSVRYLKSTFRGIISWAPHYVFLCIPATCDDETVAETANGASEQATELSQALSHLELYAKLDLPTVIVITKMDNASRTGLRKNLAQILSVLKSSRRKPSMLSMPAGPVTDLQHVGVKDVDEVRKLVVSTDSWQSTVPIVLTSAVDGSGIAKLHALLRCLPIPKRPPLRDVSLPKALAPPISFETVFDVDEVFAIPPSKVTHTTDLTSLALTCSALHSLAIPQMYSRFDIVWPETLSTSDHPAGVDALSYGLATLVMGEDIFREVPARRSQPCSHCGCSHPPGPTEASASPRIRRGNYYAQYTRKFSVGNGPLQWVQEYAVTKETGKMLGTLVALAVARMVNLETFIWDMPTGVLRDVWVALASLATRQGHECRLERVWVRWHDNSDNALRSLVAAAPTASSVTLPHAPATVLGSAGNTALWQRYGHVEYPSLSILPALKSLSVLDIDEPSYLEEMGVLVERSRHRLKELRIGISNKACQAAWLKPAGNWQAQQPTLPNGIIGWPRSGGVLGVVLGRSEDLTRPEGARVSTTKGEAATTPPETSPAAGSAPDNRGLSTAGSSPHSNDGIPGLSLIMEHTHITSPAASSPPASKPAPIPNKPTGPGTGVEAAPEHGRRLLQLETLELERVALSIPVAVHVLDWSKLTTLTILRCENHEKLWRALRRQFSPSPSRGKGGASPEYALRLKHIHTDAVSPYLLLFIKDTLAPNTLETLFLHESPMSESIVTIDAIYKNAIRNHHLSLQKILVDSNQRSPGGAEMAPSRWYKWMFTRPMITFLSSGRMPRLRELSITLHARDWHYFVQRLPYMPQLRALHIPHIARHIQRDPKELAMLILDVVTIRPEIGLTYLGIQSKCYEILEGKEGDPGSEYYDTDDSHSEGFVPGGEDWPGSETNDEDESDDDGGASAIHPLSDAASSEGRGSSDGEDEGEGRSRVTFRLREILFYDDKIAIFKARHGVL
ncbi:uncharacterized protein BP01DRAFT_415004 [Aspergillus saccharolyticus JOP 1030-1]|uniref:Tr-type G domain-containing protein n=1 Tax=Aspergillus saccharolyticus JOP 1030-1 TaxID=1450539 RepID=A0A319A2T1_9EURO|nr:hypothetical protein BP01DRAFT_415004 [Aspergillus saccharolyticus JOP 1030-1]PYH46528.1 hypothetical protein BP01DRAFT_415004 [Aspergillus saccharolyticus JOP 1030-1]